MRIVNIEIPPTLNCNQNTVQFAGNQIQDSKYKIGVFEGKGQIIFQFKIELTPSQHSEIECLITLAVPFLKCNATLSIAEAPGASGIIKAELKYNGTEYTLTGFV